MSAASVSLLTSGLSLVVAVIGAFLNVRFLTSAPFPVMIVIGALLYVSVGVLTSGPFPVTMVIRSVAVC